MQRSARRRAALDQTLLVFTFCQTKPVGALPRFILVRHLTVPRYLFAESGEYASPFKSRFDVASIIDAAAEPIGSGASPQS